MATIQARGDVTHRPDRRSTPLLEIQIIDDAIQHILPKFQNLFHGQIRVLGNESSDSFWQNMNATKHFTHTGKVKVQHVTPVGLGVNAIWKTNIRPVVRATSLLFFSGHFSPSGCQMTFACCWLMLVYGGGVLAPAAVFDFTRFSSHGLAFAWSTLYQVFALQP